MRSVHRRSLQTCPERRLPSLKFLPQVMLSACYCTPARRHCRSQVHTGGGPSWNGSPHRTSGNSIVYVFVDDSAPPPLLCVNVVVLLRLPRSSSKPRWYRRLSGLSDKATLSCMRYTNALRRAQKKRRGVTPGALLRSSHVARASGPSTYPLRGGPGVGRAESGRRNSLRLIRYEDRINLDLEHIIADLPV